MIQNDPLFLTERPYNLISVQSSSKAADFQSLLTIPVFCSAVIFVPTLTGLEVETARCGFLSYRAATNDFLMTREGIVFIHFMTPSLIQGETSRGS